MSKLNRQIDLSDVVSFHNYDSPTEFGRWVRWLQRYNRPLLCTEYMARGNGSTFIGSMHAAKKYDVAVYNWDLVQGKTRTHLQWDSWQQPYLNREPTIWFHEVFRTDGTPYTQEGGFHQAHDRVTRSAKFRPSTTSSPRERVITRLAL